MRVFGVDEAGYGPRLGPLVAGLAGFKGGEDQVERILGGLPVEISDSKKIYSPTKGIAALERTALYFIGRNGIKHAAFGELPPLETQPPLNPAAGTDTYETASAAGIEPIIKAMVISPAVFNTQASTVKKQMVVFRMFCDFIRHFAGRFPSEPILFNCGKLSGTKFYAAGLEHFLGQRYGALKETRGESAYESPDGRITVRFLLDAEDRSKAVALASIVAKYVRELYMSDFNRQWAVPHKIRPTAGYGLDADRFMRELREKTRFDGQELIRIK